MKPEMKPKKENFKGFKEKLEKNWSKIKKLEEEIKDILINKMETKKLNLGSNIVQYKNFSQINC